MYKSVMLLSLALGTMLSALPVAAAPSPTPKPEVKTEANAEVKPAVAPAPPAPRIHQVNPGESLSMIAGFAQMPSWRPLWDANAEITDPDILHVGQKLVIPDGPVAERPLPVVAAAPVAAVNTYRAPVKRTATPANYAEGAGGILARIRQRESGGNYAINTGNGYYGAYQYDQQTWNNYGGYARADLAPPAVQDAKAADTYARRGCSPWPNTCY